MITTPDITFPRADERCLCGSGKYFAVCCGSLAPERAPPDGVHVVHDAITDEDCQTIIDIANNNSKRWLTTRGVNPETGEPMPVRDSKRITQGVDLSTSYETINQMVGNVWVKTIQPLMGVEMEWFEQPGLLCYPEGGRYIEHSDAEAFNAETQLWERTLERDISMLLYVNDEYEGGYINFPKFNYRYRPQKADLVVFPSDHRYVHQAEQVTSGIRYAVVSWGAVKGGPRSYDEPPGNAITITY